MVPKSPFPEPGTPEFDKFIHEMEELFQLLSDPKECFRRAEICEEKAKQTSKRSERSVLLELAGHWRDMGIHYEIKAMFPIKP